jgi:hypothetical protein
MDGGHGWWSWMVVMAALESLAGWPGYSAVRTVDIQSSLQKLDG